jgi:hypothetical protein
MRRLARSAFVAAILLCLAVAAGAGEELRGNVRSRVFHQSSCRYYGCANCTARFATVKEAVGKGYRACGVCRPGDSVAGSAAVTASRFVGNTKSRKFHHSSCRYAGCANCTADFETRKQAVAAGYAPGGCCRP